MAQSQPFPHVPWDHDHTPGNTAYCYAYAMNRAFGKAFNDPVCPAGTITGDGINTTYFDLIEQKGNKQHIDYSKIEENDVVQFGDHAAWVYSIDEEDHNSNNSAGIFVYHKESYWVTTESYDALSELEKPNKHGLVTEVYRRKNTWAITVENSFHQRDIVIRGNVKSSGHTDSTLV